MYTKREMIVTLTTQLRYLTASLTSSYNLKLTTHQSAGRYCCCQLLLVSYWDVAAHYPLPSAHYPLPSAPLIPFILHWQPPGPNAGPRPGRQASGSQDTSYHGRAQVQSTRVSAITAGSLEPLTETAQPALLLHLSRYLSDIHCMHIPPIPLPQLSE